MRTRLAATTAIAALALTLAGCADDDEAPTRASENNTTEEPEAPAEEQNEAATVPTDLALGDTHNWSDGISLTITSVTAVPTSELDQFEAEFIPEGEIPIELAVTVTNGSQEPVDLSEFSFFIEGATTGGEATSQFFEGDEFLDGRLAPGQSRDHTSHYSFNTSEYGTDITIEGFRIYDEMDLDSPVWVAAIG